VIYIARMGEARNANKILDGQSERKKLLGKYKH
jgi:hypothetical protein